MVILEGQGQSVGAQIVGPPLEEGDAHRYVQGVADQGQVAMEKLILKIAGTGGDKNLAPGEQGRGQVGIGLAGPRAGLADQGAAFRQDLGHLLRHGLLLGAMVVASKAAGEETVGTQDIGDLAHGSANSREVIPNNIEF